MPFRSISQTKVANFSSLRDLGYNPNRSLETYIDKKLKIIGFILQNHIHLPSLSSGNLGCKAPKIPLIPSLRTSYLVYFWEHNLHLVPFCLSSLVGSPIFFKLKYTHFTPKNPLFDRHFAPTSHIFRDSRRFNLYNYSGYLYFSFRI